MSRRLALLALGLCLLLLVLGLGSALDASSTSLYECVAEPSRCEGVELFLGYARVETVEEGQVTLASWAGPVTLDGWPANTPLPSPGDSISLLGSHEHDRVVRPRVVRAHPYRWVKERTGLTMAAIWAAIGLMWLRWGWRRA